MPEEEESIDAMLETLAEAKESDTDRSNRDCCENCEMISGTTSVKTKERGRRELHYCRKCDRLLSTDEYEKWRAIRTW